jgi:alpha-L-rhamnosidase
VLTDAGHVDVAFRLLLQDTPPSWLHLVDRGATTIWESWEGYDEHGNARVSHNHYALGAVTQWLREALVGISPAAPGYRRVRIAPVVGGGFTWAEGSVETPFGRVRTRWELEGDRGALEIDVPAGTQADVQLPDGARHTTVAGSHLLEWSAD